MDTRFDSLDPRFKPIAIELVARIVEARVPVVIINTLRTDEEQADCLKRGVSWVKRSKHQDGLAIDLAPIGQIMNYGIRKLDWNADNPAWKRMGEIGEKLGLRWGGRWKTPDLGHFELVVSNVVSIAEVGHDSIPDATGTCVA